jgi:hypothetical protein
MADLQSADFGTGQSGSNTPPVTIASAATISPTTGLTVLTGTAAVANIVPPLTGFHMLVLMGAGPFTLVATGNIKVASATVVANVPVILFYNPLDGKYYGGNVKVT